jgi:Neuraminidase (sialidase)
MFLRGNNVPDRDGSFGDESRKDGDVFHIEVFNSDGTSAGTATGKTEAEVVASAQALLDEA